MERDKEEDEIPQIIMKILLDTKSRIFKDCFNYLGFDAAYFDVDINLRVRVDDKIVQIKDGWKRVTEA